LRDERVEEEQRPTRRELWHQLVNMKAKLSQNRQEIESLKGSTDAQLEKTVTQEQLTQAVKEREDTTKQLASKTLEYDKLRESLTAKIGALERELASLREDTAKQIAEYKSRLLMGAELSPPIARAAIAMSKDDLSIPIIQTSLCEL
jgi:septal ring factor EnvC (AmiA/AmiB activator)